MSKFNHLTPFVAIYMTTVDELLGQQSWSVSRRKYYVFCGVTKINFWRYLGHQSEGEIILVSWREMTAAER